ncbi:MAG: cytochrome P450 [Rhizobiaceae bacterium]
MRPPEFNIDMAAFRHDPYPVLAEMRDKAPIAFVPQLDGIVITRRDDIFICEKNIEVFSSHQPKGLMNRLMGHNMMRKDGDDHQRERKMIFPSVSPKTVRDTWKARFQADADRLIDALAPQARADLVADYALPLSGEALKAVTGLTNITYAQMDQWSQAMIDGIANYHGDPEVEARCHRATAGIDAAIDAMIPALRGKPDCSLLSVMMQAGLAMDSTRANVKLAISGGQNEPRDAIAGCAWALLTHPAELEKVTGGDVTWLQAFEEYARWISPIGMSPRRVAVAHTYQGLDFEPEDRVFLMFGSANRDERMFEEPERFIVGRDTQKSIPFGAGPHFCAGAWTSRALVAEVALPTLFSRLKGLAVDDGEPVRFDGWAFRGPLKLPLRWTA